MQRALKNTLGEHIDNVILYYLKDRYGITPEEGAPNPRALCRGLTGIFGMGAQFVIESILDETKSVESPGENFIRFVEVLRKYKERNFSIRKSNL